MYSAYITIKLPYLNAFGILKHRNWEIRILKMSQILLNTFIDCHGKFFVLTSLTFYVFVFYQTKHKDTFWSPETR